MAKVTSKLQVTVPRAIADRYGIRPGDDIEWIATGEMIRVVPPGKAIERLDQKARLRLFDLATERQRKRRTASRRPPARERGWTRAELYDRGRAR